MVVLVSGEPATANADEVCLPRFLNSVVQILGSEFDGSSCLGLSNIEQSFGCWRGVFRAAGLVFDVDVRRLLDRLPRGFDW